MNDPGIGFKRIIIDLAHGSTNFAAVEAAADFAELLNIELLATFITDATLPALAALSGARELRVLEREWQTIDYEQIGRETDQAVDRARRRFAESIGNRAIRTGFDVLAGADAIASLISIDDIVTIVEPAHPAERITWQFTALFEAAFAAAGAVLVLPRKVVRTTGPIVTTASEADDLAARAALRIAAAHKERLIILTATGTRPPPALFAEAESLGVRIEHISGPPPDRAQLVAARHFGERLHVLPANMLVGDAARLLSRLEGIPLLLIR